MHQTSKGYRIIKNAFLKKLSYHCMFCLIFLLVFSTSTLTADKLPTVTDKANLERATSVEPTPIRETYPVMRPDRETRLRWIRDFESAPKATIDHKLMETMAPQAAMSLLSRLQYTPTERDQDKCGNCWIWAGTGVMGIDLDVNRSVQDRLSTQYPQSCITGNYPCCAGNLSRLADFYTTNKQALPWANTNANWVDGGTTCATGTSGRVCGTISTTPDYGIVSIDDASITTHTVGETTAIYNIKGILFNNKGVYFGFYLPNDTAWNDFSTFWVTQNENVIWDFDPYHGIPYNHDTGGGHGVLCVGFNDNDPNPDNHYWIMLNSWGAPALRPNGLFRVKMHMNYDNADSVSSYNLRWQTLNMTWETLSLPPTCNLSFLPLLLSGDTTFSCPAIPNGNFESGDVSWAEMSVLGLDLIDQWPPVTAHSGTWYTWLGGADNEDAAIQQQVTVPSMCPYLVFYHWIGSTDSCGYDYGYVRINGINAIPAIQLCNDQNTGGWVRKSINLSSYANQTVIIKFQAVTDSSLSSNWFIDDVSFQR